MMNRIGRIGLGAYIGLSWLSGIAFAQSSPGFVPGQVVTAPQLNAAFALKQDYSTTLGSLILAGAGATNCQLPYFTGGSSMGLLSLDPSLTCSGGVLSVSGAPGGPWSPSQGGTGVANNNSDTITLGGPVSFAGAVSAAGAITLGGTLTTAGALTIADLSTANELLYTTSSRSIGVLPPGTIPASFTTLTATVALDVTNGSDIIQAAEDGSGHLIFSDGEASPPVVATGTGVISGSTMTISGTVTGTFARNQPISCAPVACAAGSYIVHWLGATGGDGTYTVSPSQTVASTTVTATQPAAKSLVVLNNSSMSVSPSPSLTDGFAWFADVDPNTVVGQGRNTTGLWPTNVEINRDTNFGEANFCVAMFAGGPAGQARVCLGTMHAPTTGTPGPFYWFGQTINVGTNWTGTATIAPLAAAIPNVSPATSTITEDTTVTGTLVQGAIITSGACQGTTVISTPSGSPLTATVSGTCTIASPTSMVATTAAYLPEVFSNGLYTAFTIPPTSPPSTTPPTTAFGAGGLTSPAIGVNVASIASGAFLDVNTGYSSDFQITNCTISNVNCLVFEPGMYIAGGGQIMSIVAPVSGAIAFSVNAGSVVASVDMTGFNSSTHSSLGTATNYWGEGFLQSLVLNGATLGSNVLAVNGNVNVAGGSFGLSGSFFAADWGTAGVGYANVASTITDTSSSGTVATAYTDLFGGNTIAASTATTFTNYYGMYIKVPVAGTNVTMTSKTALGVDSLAVNGAANIVGGVLGVSGNLTVASLNGTSTVAGLTAGTRFNEVAATITTSDAAGTVAYGALNVAGADTITDSNAAVFTTLFDWYFHAPGTPAGSASATNIYALGADSLDIAGTLTNGGSAFTVSPAMTYSSTGAITEATIGGVLTPTGASASTTTGLNVNPTIGTYSGNISLLRGMVGEFTVGSGYSGTIAAGYGIEAEALNNGTNPITAADDVFAQAISNGNGSTSGTITNCGFCAAAHTAAGGVGGNVTNIEAGLVLGTGASATTTNIGLQITGNGGAGSTAYAIYDTSTAAVLMDGAVTLGGTLTANSLATGGTYTAALCRTSTGSIQGDTSGTICGLSAARFKNLLDDPLDPTGLLALRTESWRYKPEYQDGGDVEHVGLIADDVAEMDPRCAIRDKEGRVSNYSDRCVEAYLVAMVKAQQREISELQR